MDIWTLFFTTYQENKFINLAINANLWTPRSKASIVELRPLHGGATTMPTYSTTVQIAVMHYCESSEYRTAGYDNELVMSYKIASVYRKKAAQRIGEV